MVKKNWYTLSITYPINPRGCPPLGTISLGQAVIVPDNHTPTKVPEHHGQILVSNLLGVEPHSGKCVNGLTRFDEFVQYRCFSRRIQTQKYNSSHFVVVDTR
jgi:hypothetical protein